MKTTFKTSGFKELERALVDELPKATARNVLLRTARQSMKRIETRMAELAPKDEGTLSQSMTTQNVKAKRQSRTRFEKQSGVGVITGPAPEGQEARSNAGWQEEGTVHQPAQPYARPAADAESANVIEDVKAALTLEIDKAKKRIARKAAKGK